MQQRRTATGGASSVLRHGTQSIFDTAPGCPRAERIYRIFIQFVWRSQIRHLPSILLPQSCE